MTYSKKRIFTLIGGALALTPLSTMAELIAYYSFDSAQPLSDDSGNSNTLTLPSGTEAGGGPVLEANGFMGQAYSFQGTRFIAPIDVNPSVLPQMTWGAWVRTNSLTGRQKVLGHDDNGWDRALGKDDRAPATGSRWTSFTGNAEVSNTGPVEGTPVVDSTDAWTFIAATYDQATEQVVVYVDTDADTMTDDVVAVSEPAGFGPSRFTTFAIGGLRPDNAAEAWNGLIDGVFVFDNVLTAAEITEIRNTRGASILGNANLVATVGTNSLAQVAGSGPFTQEVTLTNNGSTDAVMVTALNFGGADAAAFSLANGNAPALPFSLAAGSSQTVTVTFSPTEFRDYAASLEITTDSTTRPTSQVQLNSTVISDPQILLEPTTGLFDGLTAAEGGTTVIREMFLRNIANNDNSNDLTITGVQITGPDAGLFRVDENFPFDIEPASIEFLEVLFTPPSRGGSFQAALVVQSSDPDDGMASIDLSTVVPFDPSLSVAGPQGGLGTVGSSGGSRTYTVTNQSTRQDLVLTNFVITGANADQFSVTANGMALGAGSSLTVPPNMTVDLEVTVSGQMLGQNSGTLTFDSNAPEMPMVSQVLDANVVEGSVTVLMSPSVNDGSFEESFGVRLRGTGNQISNSENNTRRAGIWSYSVTDLAGMELPRPAGTLGFVEFRGNLGPSSAKGGTNDTGLQLASEGSLNPDAATNRAVSAFTDNGDRSLTFETDELPLPTGLQAGQTLVWQMDIQGIPNFVPVTLTEGFAQLGIEFGTNSDAGVIDLSGQVSPQNTDGDNNTFDTVMGQYVLTAADVAASVFKVQFKIENRITGETDNREGRVFVDDIRLSVRSQAPTVNPPAGNRIVVTNATRNADGTFALQWTNAGSGAVQVRANPNLMVPVAQWPIVVPSTTNTMATTPVLAGDEHFLVVEPVAQP